MLAYLGPSTLERPVCQVTKAQLGNTQQFLTWRRRSDFIYGVEGVCESETGERPQKYILRLG